jgi:hypothetical protein
MRADAGNRPDRAVGHGALATAMGARGGSRRRLRDRAALCGPAVALAKGARGTRDRRARPQVPPDLVRSSGRARDRPRRPLGRVPQAAQGQRGDTRLEALGDARRPGKPPPCARQDPRPSAARRARAPGTRALGARLSGLKRLPARLDASGTGGDSEPDRRRGHGRSRRWAPQHDHFTSERSSRSRLPTWASRGFAKAKRRPASASRSPSAG